MNKCKEIANRLCEIKKANKLNTISDEETSIEMKKIYNDLSPDEEIGVDLCLKQLEKY